MLRLVLRSLRYRLGALAATVVALICGGLTVIACAALMDTGIRFDVPAQRLAAAPVVVTGDARVALPDGSTATLDERVRVPEGLADDLAALPGVAGTVADVAVPAAVLREFRPVGTDTHAHGWSSAELMPYRLTSGAPPNGPDDVVLDAALARESGAAPGTQVQLAVRGTTRTLEVTGVAAPAAPTTQNAVFLADDHLADLAIEPGKVDAIAVLAEPGTDPAALARAVRAEVGPSLTVLTGADRGLAEFPQALKRSLDLIVIAAVFGGMAIIVALLGTSTMLALSVQQRAREFALLKAVGATPAQLRGLIVGEALVLAAVTTALAIVPGRLLGQWLYDRLVASGLAPEQVLFQDSWIVTAVAVVFVLLSAVGAGLIAGRRAARVSAVQALTEADVQTRWFSRVRVVLAALCFMAAGSCFAVTAFVMSGPITSAVAAPVVFWSCVGLGLIGPAVARAMVGVVGAPLRLTGVSGRLAAGNSRRRFVGVAAVLTPLTLLTGFAAADFYMGTTEVAVTERAYTDDLRADVVVNAPPGGFTADTVEQVRAVPGVAAASGFAASTGYVAQPADPLQTVDGWPLQGVDADGAQETAPVSVTAGSLAGLRGDTVALAERHAAELGVGIGDTVTLQLGDGARVSPRVIALFSADKTFEKVLLPAELLSEHVTAGLPSQILVRAQPGTDPAQLAATLTASGAVPPGSWATDRAALREIYSENVDTQVLAMYLAVGIIVAFTAIVAVNSLAMSTGRRRREFALQRLVGATQGQVLRMVSLEGLLVAAIAILLGTAAAAGALIAFGVSRAGSPVPIGPPWIYLAIVGTVVVLTLAATVLPAWFALRPRPIYALGTAE